MKLVVFLFTLTLSLKNYGQELTVKETINYIENLYKKNNLFNSSMNKLIDFKIDITSDGYITITDITSELAFKGDYSAKYWKTNEYICEFHYKDIDPINIRIEDSKLSIRCRFEKCLTSKGGILNNFKWSYTTVGVKLHDRDVQKVKNAFTYLLDLLKYDPEYNKKDDDPFSPWNFNNDIQNSSNSNFQIIKLISEGGVLKIPVKLGNVPTLMILDSGASDVSITQSMEKTLLESKIIKKGNYISSSLYRIASGEIVQCRRFVLPNITVKKFVVKNVICSVNPSGDVMLLGNAFLKKFASWKINNANQTLELSK